jgi:hypothetical protein
MIVAADAILLGESRAHVLSLEEARILLGACSGDADELAGASPGAARAAERLREAGLLTDSGSARDLWSEFGWTRARDLFECVRSERRALPGDAESLSDGGRQVPTGGPDLLRTMLARRSRRLFQREPVGAAAFAALTSRAATECRSRPQHRLYLLAQSIEGLAPGAYVLDAAGTWAPVGEPVPRPTLLKAVHGMWWVNGGGGIFFMGADIAQLSSREYFRVLLDTSGLCQALLEPIYQCGLGGWMTPALDEAQVREILRIEAATFEILMLLKFGTPRDPLTKVTAPEDLEHFEGAFPGLR